jgi:hypothetical protein
VLALKDVLAAPTWVSLTTGYADPKAGTPANMLIWHTDVRAGGWSVLRREITDLARIVNTTAPDADGEYGVELAGSVGFDVAQGAALYAGVETMGTVLDIHYDGTQTRTFDGQTYTGITSLTVRLPINRPDVNPYWLGRTAGTGVFRELTRVQRFGTDTVVQWLDTQVAIGKPYEYALQSYGLLDPTTHSPLSEIRYVLAGDVIPPGGIVFDPLYPQVVNGKATVLFDTPLDEDYAGVRVFFQDTLLNGACGAGATPTSFVFATAPTTSAQGAQVEILTGPCAGQVRTLGAGSGTTYALEPLTTWSELVPGETAPTAGSTARVFQLVDVVTDYGLPNTNDQFVFDLVLDATTKLPKAGLYLFCSFDRALNLQDPLGSTGDGTGTGTGSTLPPGWTFDPTDSTTVIDHNLAPTVGLRQLRPDEQQLRWPQPLDPAQPWYGDTANWAVVELTARDPVDGTTGVVLEYSGRTTTSGTAAGPNSTTQLNGTSALGAVNAWQNWLLEVDVPYVAPVPPAGDIGTPPPPGDPVPIGGGGPVPTAGQYPNLPSGMERVVETSFTSDTMEKGSASGGTWLDPDDANTAYATVSGATVLDTTFPTGLPRGQAPTTTRFWDRLDLGSTSGTRYRQVYCSLRFTLPGADFQCQEEITKFVYFGYGNTSNDNDSFFGLAGNDDPTPRSAFRFVALISPCDNLDGGSLRFNANRTTSSLVTCGPEHQVEVYQHVGTVDQHDGTFKLWVDGILTHEYSPATGNGVKYLDSRHDFTQGIFNAQWTPVWGGNTGIAARTRTDHILLNHLYVAGIR